MLIKYKQFLIALRSIKALILCLCFSLVLFPLLGEGTKQLRPTEADDGYINLMDQQNNLGTERTFALYTSTDETRLNIRVSDPTNERIYLGFRSFSTDDLFFRIKDPNGNIIVAETAVPMTDGLDGRILDYDEAVAGPNVINVAGYMAIEVIPVAGLAGDYSIEFRDPEHVPGSVYEKRIFELFDITVVNTTLNIGIDGRLWSKSWDLTTNGSSNDFNSSVFIYTNDQITTKTTFNGIQPWSFIIQSNSTGPNNVGDVEEDRKSINGGVLLPEYKIFLNAPDQIEFPPSELPVVQGFPNIDLCNTTATGYCINLELSNPGVVEYVLDIDGGEGYDDARDVKLIAPVVAGENCLPWNGLDGQGNTLTIADEFDIIFTYQAGITHLFIHDAEENPNGFNVDVVAPTGGLTDPILFYDNSNVTGTTDLVGCTSDCHTWSSNFGNDKTLNTWWVTYLENDTIKNVSVNNSTISSEVSIAVPSAVGCNGSAMDLEANNIVNGGSSPTFEWLINDVGVGSGSTFSVSDVNEGDVVKLVLSPTESCVLRDTAEITIILPKTPIVSNDTSLCINDSILLSSNTYGESFKWLNNDTLYSLDTAIKVPVQDDMVYEAVITYSNPSVNVISNGDFESGLTGFTSEYTYTPGTVSHGRYTLVTNGRDALRPFYEITDHTSGSGNMMAVDGNTVDGSVVYETIVNVVSGATYNFSAWATSLYRTNAPILQFTVNGQQLDLMTLDLAPRWTQFNTNWVSNVTGSISLTIINRNTGGGGNDFALDDIVFGPVAVCSDLVTVTKIDSAFTEAPIEQYANVCLGEDVEVGVVVSDTSLLGNSPSYSWYINSSPVATANSSNLVSNNLVDGDSITLITNSSSIQQCLSKVDTSSFIISVYNKPEVSVSGSSICVGDTAVLSATILGEQNPVTYSWAPAVTLSNDNLDETNAFPLSTTIYELYVEDGNGCKDTADYELVVHDNPEVSINGNDICEGTDAVLTSSIFNALAPVVYSWSTGETGVDEITVSPTINTTYEVYVEDGNGCKDTADYELVVHDNPDVSIDGNDICEGTDAVLKSSIFNALSPVVYSWSTGETGVDEINVLPLVTTTYKLSVQDGNGCIDSASFIVGVTNLPTALILGNDTSICDGQSLNINAYDDITEDYTFSWLYGEDSLSLSMLSNTSTTHTVTETGYYILEVRNNSFCPIQSSPIYVEVIETKILSVILDDVPDFCEDENVTLNASIENGGISPVISWEYDQDLSLTSSTNQLTINDLQALAGTVKVTVESSLQCVNESTNSDEINLIGLSKPVLKLITVNDTLCENEFTSIEGQELTGQTNSYQWYYNGVELLGETSLLLNNIQDGGEYTLSADNGVCPVQYSDSIGITILEVPTADASYNLDYLQEYLFTDEIELIGKHTGSESIWTTDDLTVQIMNPLSETTIIDVKKGGIYKFILTSSNGRCIASDSVLIDVKLPIKAPNVFTPNGDGQNDEFIISGIETYPAATVSIFNRWGVIVYETTNYSGAEWTGLDVPDGVYYYLITLPDSEDGEGHSGVIHVIK